VMWLAVDNCCKCHDGNPRNRSAIRWCCKLTRFIKPCMAMISPAASDEKHLTSQVYRRNQVRVHSVTARQDRARHLPLFRQSFLLSSKTVFMFSIQICARVFWGVQKRMCVWLPFTAVATNSTLGTKPTYTTHDAFHGLRRSHA
jgi:hypothetical protein